MPFAAAVSEHPLATQAVGECVGEVLEALGPDLDLVALFVTGPHAGALEDIVGTVRTLLRPDVLVGGAATGVVGPHREVEATAGVTLWAARFARPDAVRTVRLQTVVGRDGVGVAGLPDDVGEAGALVVLADPSTFDLQALVEQTGQAAPDLDVVGGLVSPGPGEGAARLVLDGSVLADGAVGVLFAPDVAPEVAVAQGCRPIGPPFTVTRAERNVLYELAGQPALTRLLAMVEQLPPDDRALAARGLHCGIVVDESKVDHEPGDFVVRGVLGADRSIGAVAIGQAVEVGATVQFQVVDPDTASSELHGALDPAQADGALVFTCQGRGLGLFGVADHDAAVVADVLGTSSVAGATCGAEVGPVAGRSRVQTYSAAVAWFTDRAGDAHRRPGPSGPERIDG